MRGRLREDGEGLYEGGVPLHRDAFVGRDGEAAQRPHWTHCLVEDFSEQGEIAVTVQVQLKLAFHQGVRTHAGCFTST